MAEILHTTPMAQLALKKSWMLLIAWGFLALQMVCISVDTPQLLVVPFILLAGVAAFWHYGFAPAALFLVLFSSSLFILKWPVHLLWFTPAEWAVILAVFFLPLLFFDRRFTGAIRSLPHRWSIVVIICGVAVTEIHAFAAKGMLWEFTLLFDVKLLIAIGVYVAVYSLLRTHTIRLRTVLNAVALSGVLLLIAVLAKYYARGAMGMLLGERLGVSIIESPNITSSLLDMLLPVTIFLAQVQKHKGMRILYGGLSMLYLVVIFLTYSRGSLAGLALLSAYFVTRRVTVKKLALMLLILSLSVTIFGGGFAERILMKNPATAISNLARVELLRASLKIAHENKYVFGAGMNAFCKLKFQHGFPAWFDVRRVMSTHNLYMEYFVGIGLIGFLGIVSFYLMNVVRLFRARPPGEMAQLRRGVLLGMLLFLVHGLVDCAIGYSSITTVFSTLLACSAYISECSADAARSRTDSTE